MEPTKALYEMQRCGLHCPFTLFATKSSHDWNMCIIHLLAFVAGLTPFLFSRQNDDQMIKT